LREREHLPGSGSEGRIILKWIFKKQDMGKNWVNLVQEWDKWRAFVKMAKDFRVQ
jgi:hypothetical protein